MLPGLRRFSLEIVSGFGGNLVLVDVPIDRLSLMGFLWGGSLNPAFLNPSTSESDVPRLWLPRSLAAVALGGLLASLVLLYLRPVLRHREHVFVLLGSLFLFCVFAVMLHRFRVFGTLGVVVVSFAAIGVSVVAPPASSNDVAAYTFYGRELAIHRVNPYVAKPSDFPNDPFLEAVQPIWRNTGSVYGPLFSGVAGAFAWLAGDSALVARLLFQILAGLALAAAILILARRRAPPVAIAFLGLNPLVLSLLVNGAHNDVLVGLAVLVAYTQIERDQHVRAGVALGIGALVKLSALVPAGLLVVWVLREGKVRGAVAQASIVMGMLTIGYAMFGGLQALKPLSTAARLVGFSAWDVPAQLSRLKAALNPGFEAFMASPAPTWVIGALALAALIVTVGRRWATPAAAITLGTLVYFLGVPYILPWHLAPAIFLASFAGAGTRVAVGLQLALLSVAYVIGLGPPPRGDAWFAYVRFRAGVGIWSAIALALLVGWAAASFLLRSIRQPAGAALPARRTSPASMLSQPDITRQDGSS